METTKVKSERIDIRVSPEEKEIFLKAQKLSGERSFTAFITRIIKSKSLEIIEKNEQILASDRDREIFFEALMKDQEPNQVLKEAADKYKLSMS